MRLNKGQKKEMTSKETYDRYSNTEFGAVKDKEHRIIFRDTNSIMLLLLSIIRLRKIALVNEVKAWRNA